MKKIIILFMLMVSVVTSAQNSGLGFNYQAVVRDAYGILLADSDVKLRVSLYPGQLASQPTWIETHSVHTDISGSFGITVGKGVRDANSMVGKYTDINFAAVYYWMKIEIMEGDAYREVSFAQLPSSPYAEVAHNAAAVPVGMIMPFAGPAENIPYGWLLCDGAAISRTEYAELYNAIGVCWGMGDNSTTFNIPDLRGMFLRGVSGDSGHDPDANERIVLTDNGGNSGNNVGSYQGDAIRNIEAWWGSGDKRNNSPYGGAVYKRNETFKSTAWDSDSSPSLWGFDASRVVPVGKDNRPKNVYVTYIIKY